MAQQPMKAKLNYKPKSSIEVFYSGGAVSLSKHGLLACACQDDIKVLIVAFTAVRTPVSFALPLVKLWSSTSQAPVDVASVVCCRS